MAGKFFIFIAFILFLSLASIGCFKGKALVPVTFIVENHCTKSVRFYAWGYDMEPQEIYSGKQGTTGFGLKLGVLAYEDALQQVLDEEKDIERFLITYSDEHKQTLTLGEFINLSQRNPRLIYAEWVYITCNDANITSTNATRDTP